MGGVCSSPTNGRFRIDRHIPQILRACALEDLRLLGERCHLVLSATARSAVTDLLGLIHRHEEMLASKAHIEPLPLHRLARRQLEHLACHRLDERDRTIEQSRWSRIAHLRLVVGRESLNILRLGLAFEFRRRIVFQLCAINNVWILDFHFSDQFLLPCCKLCFIHK